MALHRERIPKYGRGSELLWLDNVNCKGDEVSLAECGHDGWGVHECRSNPYAMEIPIYCDNSKC